MLWLSILIVQFVANLVVAAAKETRLAAFMGMIRANSWAPAVEEGRSVDAFLRFLQLVPNSSTDQETSLLPRKSFLSLLDRRLEWTNWLLRRRR